MDGAASMTDRTKLARFKNPQALEDYGLTLTEAEALEDPELKAWIDAIRTAREEEARAGELLARLGENAAAAVGRIALDVIAATSPPETITMRTYGETRFYQSEADMVEDITGHRPKGFDR